MVQTDLDLEALSASLTNRFIGSRIIHHDSISSTMDEARREAEVGAPEGTVVIAEEQTAGRGRFSRTWVSPKGLNLLFSILLRPEPASVPRISMASSLAVAKAIQNFTGLVPTIKWPNDVQLQGRKTCGILSESSLEDIGVKYTIVGIGVNVNFDPRLVPEIADTATSIARELGSPVSRYGLLKAILEEFEPLYLAVNRGESLREEWSVLLDTLGRHIRVRWGEQIHEGSAQEVDDDGNLILLLLDGSPLKINAGDVTLQV